MFNELITQPGQQPEGLGYSRPSNALVQEEEETKACS